MASKFLVPLHLPVLTTTPSSTPQAGFVKAYVLNSWLTALNSSGVQYDLVLARPLEGFSVAGTAAQVTSSDTVLSAFGKIQKSLNSINLTGDVVGVASFASGALTISTTIQSNSVVLGSDTTGDYIANIEAALLSGIEVTDGVGEGVVAQIGLKGASDLLDKNIPAWDAALGKLVNSNIENVDGGAQVTGDFVVTGNLSVNGTVTTINTETVLIADNIITLNSNVTGTPTENAGIEVERGTLANVSIRWNETSDKWELTNDGTNFNAITTSASAPVVNAGDGIDVAVVGNAVTVSHADTSSVADTTNAAAGTQVVQNLSFDQFGHVVGATSVALKFEAILGDGANTNFVVNHNKGERFVISQIFDNMTNEAVDAYITIVDSNTLQVDFEVVPALAQYTIVVI